MNLIIEENLILEIASEKHALRLFNAVDNNRKHLSVFLPWVAHMQSSDNMLQYLKNCELLYKNNKEISFVILYNGALVGRIGLHYIDLQNKTASIGYWLAKDAEGKGIVTKCCIKLIAYAFEELNLNRLELKAAEKNLRSQAIPEKLNFKKEGILREAEYINNEFVNLQLYSLLKSEWNNRIPFL